MKSNFNEQLKNKIIELIKQNYVGKKFSKKALKIIACQKKLNYGNTIRALNNLIFICEKINCNKILVEDNIWNIKNPIVYEKYNIVIEHVDSINCMNDDNIICLNRNLSFYF